MRLLITLRVSDVNIKDSLCVHGLTQFIYSWLAIVLPIKIPFLSFLYFLLIYKCFIKEVVCLCVAGDLIKDNLLNAAHRYAFMILLAMASPILL